MRPLEISAEEYRKLAAGAEAPPILTEEEAFGPFYDDYDPLTTPRGRRCPMGSLASRAAKEQGNQ